jgi:hypothetical protein
VQCPERAKRESVRGYRPNSPASWAAALYRRGMALASASHAYHPASDHLRVLPTSHYHVQAMRTTPTRSRHPWWPGRASASACLTVTWYVRAAGDGQLKRLRDARGAGWCDDRLGHTPCPVPSPFALNAGLQGDL